MTSIVVLNNGSLHIYVCIELDLVSMHLVEGEIFSQVDCGDFTALY